ncbi:MAG: DUF3370 family protein [Nostoc sp.]
MSTTLLNLHPSKLNDVRRLVEVDFLYPVDATPPQMLTIQTVDQT